MQRRQLLKIAGAATIGTTASTLPVAANSSKVDGVIVTRHTSTKNGLSKKQIDQLAKRAENKYFATYKEDLELDRVLRKKPLPTQTTNVIGYGIYISPDGRSNTFIGLAPNAEEFEDVNPGDGIQAVRNRMAEWTENIQKIQSKSDSNDITTSAVNWTNFSIDQDFSDPVALDTVYIGDGPDYCPHGHVENTTGVYKHPNDASVYAAASESELIPGAASCSNNDWGKKKYIFKQQWQSGSYDTGEVTDHVPNGYKGSSTTSVDASISASKDGLTATVGVTFDKPNLEIYDRSDSYEGNWKYIWSKPSKKSSKTVNNTSFCDFNSSTSSGQLVETYDEVTFTAYHETYSKRYSARTAYYY